MKVKKIKDQYEGKDKVIINSDDSNGSKEYFCQYCNFNTIVRMDEETLYCTHCQMISLIEDLQEVQQLQPPKTVDNTETLISTTPMPGYGDVVIKKKPNYKDSFAEMAKKGITDGAGRTISDE
jgi:ribosomal protein L37AE/L43A